MQRKIQYFMASAAQTNQKEYTELHHLPIDYYDGDIVILDHVKALNDFSSLRLKNHAIIVCSKGWMKIQTADKTVEIHADDVLLSPQNLSVDHCEFSSDFECKVLSLSEQIIHGMLHDKISVWNHAVFLNETIVVSMTEQCREEFNLYYALISSKIQNHKEAPRDIVQTLIRALLLELCSIVEKNSLIIGGDAKQSQGKTLFNRFLQMISNSEVKRQPITHYSGQLAITPKYLTMLCLKYSNKTASDWIVQYTIEDIRLYLRNSNLSIKEISGKLGFANMSHFGSYVRKHLGVSPSDFRHGK